MILILVTAIAAALLILVLNRNYIVAEASLQRLPMLESRSRAVPREGFNLFLSFGRILQSLVPRALIDDLEAEYLYLGRKRELLIELLGQVALIFTVMLGVYLLNHNVYFLVLALVIPAILLFELKLAAASYHKQLEEDTPQLFACAKILLINTETPLVSALRIIVSTWPFPESATVNELNKIISKIEKLGVREALSDWQVESQKFRDFLSFLLSVSEGSSKRALRLGLEKLINEAREEERDELANQADNLQLYLVGPVVLMLLVIMYPMAAAINFMMQTSLLKGEGL